MNTIIQGVLALAIATGAFVCYGLGREVTDLRDKVTELEATACQQTIMLENAAGMLRTHNNNWREFIKERAEVIAEMKAADEAAASDAAKVLLDVKTKDNEVETLLYSPGAVTPQD